MQPFCQDVNEYLKSDEHNVAVVHCKAGKGRTGVMICAYLVHCGDWPDARQALEFYAACRTKNSKVSAFGMRVSLPCRLIGRYDSKSVAICFVL